MNPVEYLENPDKAYVDRKIETVLAQADTHLLAELNLSPEFIRGRLFLARTDQPNSNRQLSARVRLQHHAEMAGSKFRRALHWSYTQMVIAAAFAASMLALTVGYLFDGSSALLVTVVTQALLLATAMSWSYLHARSRRMRRRNARMRELEDKPSQFASHDQSPDTAEWTR